MTLNGRLVCIIGLTLNICNLITIYFSAIEQWARDRLVTNVLSWRDTLRMSYAYQSMSVLYLAYAGTDSKILGFCELIVVV